MDPENRASDVPQSEPHVPEWVPVLPLAGIPVGGARLVRPGALRIALFRPEDDALYAVDNRCPHEGYPLSEGQVHGERILVCAWHGFVFDLRNGRCFVGDEDVRSYATRVVDGQVEIDVAEVPRANRVPELYASLTDALLERRPGQVARDLVRLLREGEAPERLAAEAAFFDARHAEYGSGHALPVAHDVMTMLERYPDGDAVLPLVHAMETASVPNARRPVRELAEPVDPGDDPRAAGVRLREAAEHLDLGRVQGVVRGALARGWGRAEIEPWGFGLATDHWFGFGHGLIYQTKVFDLLDRVGWKENGAEPLLCAFVLQLAGATREEQIPTERRLRDALGVLDARSDELWARQDAERVLGADEEAALRAVVLDGGDGDALAAVLDALDRGVSRHDLARALVVAASERILRFDFDYDGRDDVQDGWLDIIHVFTFSSAVRVALARHEAPESLRWLLFATRFIQRARSLDRAPARVVEPAAPADLDTLLAHVRSRDTDRAVAEAAGYLDAGGSPTELRDGLERLILSDHGTRAIVVAHHVKSLVAAFDEYGRLDGPDRFRPLLAAIHFISAPATEGSLGRLVLEARRFIEQGKTPRRLMV